MLKKNLHFFTRYVITAALLLCVFLLSSCAQPKENYLSFLDGDITLDCRLECGTLDAAHATVKRSNGEISVTFTSPSALCGAVLLLSEGNASLRYNGKDIRDAVIPPLWRSIAPMLEREKRILSVSCENGITEICTEAEGVAYNYKTDKDGRLISIDNGYLRLTVKEG